MTYCKYCESNNIFVATSYNYHNVLICEDCELWSCHRIEDCCRNPFIILVFQYINEQPKFIREQCLNCGGCLNMTKGLPFKQNIKKVSEKHFFSAERLEEYKQNRKHERNLIYEIEKSLKLTKTRYYKYLLHLGSPYWKEIRLRALERDAEICQKCKKEKATEVHHLTYDRLGNEVLEDLISVCRKCHCKIHGIEIICAES